VAINHFPSDTAEEVETLQKHCEAMGLKAVVSRGFVDGGKGCILVTAHWGAVEFIPWVLHASNVPTSVILECATARLARSLLFTRSVTVTTIPTAARPMRR
jgi:lauroyl/myristoyl acyltransferase